ncbi:hypothetical protein P153DRAFT_387461 [Dothidotthia symphoricarpi CBS 119687]|uniref:Uncharacterized protein n=1 Tax=Dothidotthia symphoricarpi CBS 119687 TaxID=1392245 RepID=A0A6A6AA37_9PLEO|nr:uncharacterized protein P153DRAFT_387461 [Dothidotthia symphoricarpi CBS 119687]KAF2127728.1 hypothetical protein P153DRAFT_387461 [Dothidotthia symphoricarpi CBS 119687]
MLSPTCGNGAAADQVCGLEGLLWWCVGEVEVVRRGWSSVSGDEDEDDDGRVDVDDERVDDVDDEDEDVERRCCALTDTPQPYSPTKPSARLSPSQSSSYIQGAARRTADKPPCGKPMEHRPYHTLTPFPGSAYHRQFIPALTISARKAQPRNGPCGNPTPISPPRKNLAQPAKTYGQPAKTICWKLWGSNPRTSL